MVWITAKNCENTNIDRVHFSYVKSNIKKMVREIVSELTYSLVAFTDSTENIFISPCYSCAIDAYSCRTYPFPIHIFAKRWITDRLVLYPWSCFDALFIQHVLVYLIYTIEVDLIGQSLPKIYKGGIFLREKPIAWDILTSISISMKEKIFVTTWFLPDII